MTAISENKSVKYFPLISVKFTSAGKKYNEIIPKDDIRESICSDTWHYECELEDGNVANFTGFCDEEGNFLYDKIYVDVFENTCDEYPLEEDILCVSEEIEY